MTELAKYTTELFETLEEETGQATGFKQNGSLGVATSEDGITWRRAADKPFLTPSEMGKARIEFASYLRHGGKEFVFIEAGSTFHRSCGS